MATRTVSNAGGNWNATTTWVGGVVPITGDDVNFTATSGNIVTNTGTAVLSGINFTNYVGTITIINALSVSGVVNLGTGGYTQDGASGLSITGNSTLTSNGVVWSRTLTFSGSNITYTFADTWTVTGSIFLSGTGVSTINGNTLNIGSNLTSNTTAIVSGTTTFNFNGTGTWSNVSSGPLINNTTINTSGTLTISGNVYYNTGTITYTAGTVITTGSTLNISSNTTLATSGMIWGGITTTGTLTLTLSNNLSLSGTYLLSSLTTVTFNGFAVFMGGNVTLSGTSVLGNSIIVLSGNGTWSGAGVISNNLTINTATGSRTISGSVFYQTGTMSYVAGTVSTTGSTLTLSGTSSMATNGITWNNITLTGTRVNLGNNLTLSGSLTIASATVSFALDGNNLITSSASLVINNGTIFNVPQNMTFSNFSCFITSASTINSNQIAILGNLSLGGNQNPVPYLVGTTTLVLAGTGTWSHPSGSYCALGLNTIFNTPGTIFVSGGVIFGGRTLTYISGNVVTTGSTLNVFGGGSPTYSTHGIIWNNITTPNITFSSLLTGTFTLNVGNTFSASGAVTIGTYVGNTAIITVNGAPIVTSGSLSIGPATTTTVQGTSNFIMTGNGTWSTSGLLKSNLTFNSSGTINASGTLNFNGATLSYVSGNVVTTGSTLVIGGNTTLSTGTVSWNAISASAVLTLGSDLNIAGSLSIPNSGGLSFVLNGNNLNTTTAAISLGVLSSFTVPQNITCTDLSVNGGCALNGNQISMTRSLLASNAAQKASVSGTTTLIFTGTGTWSHPSITTETFVRNTVVFNTPGTISLSTYVLFNSTLIYTSGTIVTTGSNLILNTTGLTPLSNLTTDGITWNNISVSAISGQDNVINLINPLTTTGTLTLNRCRIIGSQSNINGSLVVNDIVSGSSSLVIGGSGTWSGGGRITNNLTINTPGTLNISGGVSYDTGTLNYIAGTVITTGSTLTIFNNLLSISSVTLRTDGIVWQNITVGSLTSINIILQNNLTLTGTLLLSTTVLSFTLAGNDFITSSASLASTGNSTFNLPTTLTFRNFSNSSGTTTLNGNSINLNGNITLTGGSSTQGTTNINVIGTGTWSQVASSAITNNLTFNLPGTYIVSGTVFYRGGTLSYVAGNIVTTNSTLSIGTSTTGLNTPGLTWGAVSLATTTNIGADLIVGSTFSINVATVNGVGRSVFARGDFSVSNSNSGSATIVLNGTGVWSGTGATRIVTNNLTINTAGVITVSGVVNYSTGTITYTAGTVIVTGSTLTFDNSSTINTFGMSWNNITFASSNQTATLLSQLVAVGTMSVGNLTLNFAGFGFNVANLSQTAARILTLAAGQTNSITNNFVSTVGSEATKSTIQSSSVGTQSRLILSSNATQDLSFVNAIDINSNGGQTIYSYRGTFSRTNNWRILPTEPSGGESTSIFFG